jgi:hypothetical protein
MLSGPSRFSSFHAVILDVFIFSGPGWGGIQLLCLSVPFFPWKVCFMLHYTHMLVSLLFVTSLLSLQKVFLHFCLESFLLFWLIESLLCSFFSIYYYECRRTFYVLLLKRENGDRIIACRHQKQFFARVENGNLMHLSLAPFGKCRRVYEGMCQRQARYS